MAAGRPTILLPAEAQSRAGPEDPPFLDYTQHIVLPANGKTGAGLDVYVRSGTTIRATPLSGKEDANALRMELLTPWGKHHVLAAHAPQINTGCEPYVRWWAEIGHGGPDVHSGGDIHQLSGSANKHRNPTPE